MSNPRPRVELDAVVENLKLKSPFRISGYVFTEVPVVVATLRSEGLEGRGEAAGVYYLEDEPHGMLERIEQVRAEIEAGATREELQSLLPAGGARNALDCAMWELESKRQGVPVWRLAGLQSPRALLTTFTLGADDPDVMARGARAYEQARAIKVKLTGEADLDAERVRSIRAARPDVWLGVDANQGFDRASVERILPALIESRVELLEQPVRRGEEAQLDGFSSPIPLAADETVQTLADVAGLAGRFQVVNIKLDKCGGLTEGLAMAHEARRLGMKVMVGNMVGTSLAMAPAFVLGQLCDVVDLDGPTFLAQDRTPSISYQGGQVWSPESVWGAAQPE